MSLYTCMKCGGVDFVGWTYYYTRRAMDLPVFCATCDPNQRCHYHNDVARRAQDEADIGEVDA